MNSKGRFVLILLQFLLFLSLLGCTGGSDLAAAREKRAEKGNGDIIVALPGEETLLSEHTGFLKGVNMALAEINQAGVLGGRRIRIEIKDDQGSFIEGMTVAQDIAEDLDVIAAIGHWYSNITLSAAAVYDKAGVLLLSPVVSNSELTNKGYGCVFQNIPSDEEIGRHMLIFAETQGYRNMAIYYEDNVYGRGLADALEQAAADMGLNIVDRVSTFGNEKEQARAVAKWQALDCQAVLAAVPVAQATDAVRNARSYDPDMPVIGPDSFDVADLANNLGKEAKGVSMISLYKPSEERAELQSFIRRYREKYQKSPGIWALQGYDSLKLLVYAMEEADSAAPRKIAEVLRNLEDWPGILADVGFDQNGRLTGGKIYIKVFHDGRFDYIDKK